MIKKIIIVINLSHVVFSYLDVKASSNLEEEITKGNLYTISETFEMDIMMKNNFQALLKIYKSERP